MELMCICWIKTAEYKRFHLSIPRKGCGCRFRMVCNCIPNFRFVNLSDTRDEVADSTCAEFSSRLHFWCEDAYLLNLIRAFRLHKLNLFTRLHVPLKDACVHNDTAIVIIDGVKHECL